MFDFIRIDEDQVEGLYALAIKLCKRVERQTDANLDLVGDPRPFEVRQGDLSVLWIEFEGYQSTVPRQSSCQPNGAVAAQRSDFENALSAGQLREQMQELALERGNIDRREASGLIGIPRSLEGFVTRNKLFGKIALNFDPLFLRRGFLHRFSKRMMFRPKRN